MEENKGNRPGPTETQIEIMMSDWLGGIRGGAETDHTHKGKEGIRSDTDVAGYLLGNLDNLDKLSLMRAARHAARNVITTVVDGPSNVEFGGDLSYHVRDNGTHTVRIASDYFDDPSLTPREKAGIAIGLAAHEGAHGVYTDEDLMRRQLEADKTPLAGLRKNIWNLLEDERIENLLGEERPGYIGFVGETKRHYFKKTREMIAPSGEGPKEAIPRLLATLQQAVRYPSTLTREEIEESFDDLNAIRKALYPFPLTSEGCWKATDRVMDIIRDKAADEMRKDKPDQSGNGDQSGDNGPGGGGGQGGDPGDGGEDSQDGSAGDNGPSRDEIDRSIAKALGTEEGKRVTRALESDNNKSDPSNQSSAMRDPRQSQIINDDRSEMTGGAGPGDPRTFVLVPEGDMSSYTESLDRIRRLIPAMSKTLSCKTRDNEYRLSGMKSGRLNTNKLTQVALGNTRVFTRKGEVTSTSVSVCVLIDESGSMSGTRLEAARDAAVLINEAVARIGKVNFYCYGYTEDEITVYSERGRERRWALGSTRAWGGTPTGKAMRTIRKRVRKMTKDPVLELVLTDGYPDDAGEVITAERESRADRFIPIGVGIQCDGVRNLFRESVIITDMSTFARELGALVRGRLDNMIVRTDSGV